MALHAIQPRINCRQISQSKHGYLRLLYLILNYLLQKSVFPSETYEYHLMRSFPTLDVCVCVCVCVFEIIINLIPKVISLIKGLILIVLVYFYHLALFFCKFSANTPCSFMKFLFLPISCRFHLLSKGL